MFRFISPITCLLVLSLLLGPLAAQENLPAAKAPADPLTGPPLVSAKAWAIADGRSGEILWSHNADEARQIASTTKLMTAWIVLEIAAKDPKLLAEVATISEVASKTGGSNAGLKAGEKYLVRDLLHGLLLPSGNDAAVALAEHVGTRLPAGDEPEESTTARFIAAMNARAKLLNLNETQYFDPHGNSKNQSSPRNLITLAHHALRNETLSQVVQTRVYACEPQQADGGTRKVTWENTNKLLGIEGFSGVKTGTTTGAGFCLIARGIRDDVPLLVVVLGSTSNDSRYLDSRNLFRWAWQERVGKSSSKKM